MFGLFKKKEQKKEVDFDYSAIAVDMHSHVLPGIDDGAQNPQESIELVKKMMELGIKKIIATPHIMADYYKNNAETIGNALKILKEELKKENINIPIEAAAEHYFDETFEERVNNQTLMTMGGNYVLFELSFISKPPNLTEMIQKMLDLKYRPILAHPERYSYMDIKQLRSLREMGCLLQINTISLVGYYGRDAKKTAESLIDSDLVDFISSDMHHLRHAEALGNALSTTYVEKLVKHSYPLKNIMLK
ncbi:MAG TPA: CpsB/CapC family capsule biosynthesis tyrosine phosphatase [Mucilaginibacter sp.]|nr:CpsB/CapC family capsule biosynthesis tyrosine phosphatase [Mucilaginibacter sp.]